MGTAAGIHTGYYWSSSAEFALLAGRLYRTVGTTTGTAVQLYSTAVPVPYQYSSVLTVRLPVPVPVPVQLYASTVPVVAPPTT
jgi:hypothetical protein